MMMIRKENPGDVEAIARVTRLAFESHPHSEQTEHHIVNALRAAGALSLSLVADVDGEVVGHVAFSPVSISDGSPNWYGLGPVSVLPVRQNQGIGRALIEEGLAMLKASGAVGCVLVGEPAYYERFGFANRPALRLDDFPQEYFLALDLAPNEAAGSVTYHGAFSVRD